MSRPETKKNIAGDVPASLHDELMDWISDHKDVKIRQCVQAMTELWLRLPDRLQCILLVCKPDSDAFASVEAEIEDNVFSFIEAARYKADRASTCVRRLLLFLEDYAKTGECIRCRRDFELSLKAIYELMRSAKLKRIEGLTRKDNIAISEILKALGIWAGYVDPLCTTDAQPAESVEVDIQNAFEVVDDAQSRGGAQK